MANNNDNKVLNVPNLRFPEFTGEWKRTTIGTILTIGNGKDYKYLEKGNVPVFGTGGYMTSVDKSLYNGETTFIGRKGTINKPFFYNGEFWTVDTLFYTYAFKNIIPKFTYCLFQTINWLKYNEASGVPSLSKATIEKIKVSLPSIKEQEKISQLLFKLDERIATQNKIIEKLESLIKGLAQHISHSNGVNTKIIDCLECHTSTLQESDLCPNGLYPTYGANGIVGYTDTYQSDDEAILIIKDGSGVGSVYSVNEKFSVTGTLNYLTAKGGYSLQYIFFRLRAFNFQPYKTGMAIPHIYFKDYGKAKIYCPDYETQCSLAKGLVSIDAKIKNERAYLFKLNMQKNYLLQQMFI